jgi:hypothetical protein
VRLSASKQSSDLVYISWPLHIQNIKYWQAQTGETGAPPVNWDKKLSNWIQYARDAIRKALSANKPLPEYAPHLLALGISADHGPSTIGSTMKFARPRGIVECVDAISMSMRNGSVPSFFSDDYEIRHLACWLIRIQVGILGDNHLSHNVDDPKNVMLFEFRHQVSKKQPVYVMEAQWQEFCKRLQVVLSRTNKGDGWHNGVVAQPCVSVKDSIPTLGNYLSQSKTLTRNPIAVIRNMNRILGHVPRPVRFSTEREDTSDFVNRLVTAGYRVDPASKLYVSRDFMQPYQQPSSSLTANH